MILCTFLWNLLRNEKLSFVYWWFFLESEGARKKFDFLGYVDGEVEYILWGYTANNVIVSQNITIIQLDKDCIEKKQ